MFDRISWLGIAVALAACDGASAPADSSDGGGADDDDAGLPAPWIEAWRDDFEGPAGSAPNPANWNIEVNDHPANSELEFYTDRRDNTFLDGSGHLVIQALQEMYMGSTQPYTSGRMTTAAKFDATYGRFEARIKLPPGKGLWPAFWMLGSNIGQVAWPACGEIDIMEQAGSHPYITHGSVHGTNLDRTGEYQVSGASLTEAFHVFALEWSPDDVTWLVDGKAYQTFTRAQIESSGMTWGLDHPFFLLLNLAVGGIFDGVPGKGTMFPAQMIVDRVVVGRMPGLEAGPRMDAGVDAPLRADVEAEGDAASTSEASEASSEAEPAD